MNAEHYYRKESEKTKSCYIYIYIYMHCVKTISVRIDNMLNIPSLDQCGSSLKILKLTNYVIL